MILLVDIGNTRSKFALADTTQMQAVDSIKHSDMSVAALQRQFLDMSVLDGVFVSCVGPDEVYISLQQWSLHQFGLSPRRITVTDRACGLANGYQEQAKLGVDRWVAAIGARRKVSAGELLIVDAGTAVTIDWLDSDSVYQGGVIIPGYDLMHDSLISNTAGIDSNPEPIEQVIGKTTLQCVNAGISYGLVGAVEKIIFEMMKQISSPVTLLLTGGGAQLFKNRSDLDFLHEPQLLMHGLLRLAQEEI